MTDYYAVLNVPKHANFQQILGSYKKLISDYNYQKTINLAPEDNAAIDANMKAADEAFNFLKDPIKRALFDKHGSGNFMRQKVIDTSAVIRQKHRQNAQN